MLSETAADEGGQGDLRGAFSGARISGWGNAIEMLGTGACADTGQYPDAGARIACKMPHGGQSWGNERLVIIGSLIMSVWRVKREWK